MKENTTHETIDWHALATGLRGWTMVALTLLFVTLYAAALAGWLKPLADERVVSRLEPLVFVIIGYYFGRLPSGRNEEALRHEIGRQTQRADAAQHAKEQAMQAREALEEKIKNAHSALALVSPAASEKLPADGHVRPHPPPGPEVMPAPVAAAISILSS